MLVFAPDQSLADFLAQAQARRETRLAFSVASAGGLTDGKLRSLLDGYLPMAQQRSVRLRRNLGGWDVSVHLRYRTGVRIADAYSRGCLDNLSPEERQTLDRALVLVQEARKDFPSQIELAQRLYDVVRESAVYENPPVGTQAYARVVSAASVLLRGRANCQGFSDAFYLLGTLAGLAVDYRCQTEGSPHLFNILTLDNLPHTVDATRGLFPAFPG